MAEKVVGISDMRVAGAPDDVLLTYSLGSCVGLALWDPKAQVGGMLHAMMPSAKAHPEKAAENPAMYSDAGATLLLQTLFDRGASRDRMLAWVAGAANNIDATDRFRIGERNYAVIRKVLWKNGILIADEDVGGSVSRTMMLEVGSGRAFVRVRGSVHELRRPKGR